MEANGINIKDIGFTTYSKDGVRSTSVSCPGDKVAISSGCSCGLNFIHEQYLEGETAYCTCDGGGYMTAFVTCASIRY